MAPTPTPPGYDGARARLWLKEKVTEYEAMIISGDDMWEIAKDHMKEEIRENHLCLPDPAIKGELITLRQILRQKGVNIRKRQGVPVYKTFEEWLALPEYEWQLDDLESLIKEFGVTKLPHFVIHTVDDYTRGSRLKKVVNNETPSDANEPRHGTATAATSNTPISNVNATAPSNTAAIIGDTARVAGGVASTLLPQQFNSISKMINEDMKYSGTNDAFDHKINVFKDTCETINLLQPDYRKAMRFMLKGPALDHFFEHKDIITFDGMVASIREAFEGPDFKRSQLAKWNTLTYQKLRTENPTKSAPQCIDLLVSELYNIRRNLDDVFKSEKVLYARIIDACTGAKECHVAISNPPEKLPMLINNLKSSITTYIATYGDLFVGTVNMTEGVADTNLVDRRYNRNQFGNRNGRFGRSNYRFGRDRPTFPRSNKDRKCYVCQKPGCWSTKHTQEERDESRKRLFNRAEQRTRQYMTDMLDEEDNFEDPEDIDQYLNDTFKDLDLEDYEDLDVLD
jgi:hypothetical protein